MKSSLRILGLVFLGLLALCLLVLLTGNLYLQSSVVQDRIRQATTASLGYPVEIGQVFFTPWSGLTLGKIQATDPNAPEVEIFRARFLNIRFAWWPLLSRQFIITSISLHRPELNLSQNQSFALLPPAKPVQVTLPSDPTESALPSPPSAETPGHFPTPAASPAADEPSTGPFFTVEVRSFHFLNGRVVLRDAAGQPTLEARELSLVLRLQKDASMEGVARIGELILGHAVHFRAIEAPFIRENGTVTIEALRAELAEGLVTGSAVVAETTQDFQAQLTLQGAQIPVLLREAGLPHGQAQGALNASVQMTGGENPESWRGQGSLNLIEATLEPLDFLRQIGQLLRISELQLLRLREARADFLLNGRSLELQNLQLASENLLIRSSGTIDLKASELDLQSQLLVNDQLQRNLGGLLSGFLNPSEEPGYRGVPFRVYGPLSDPRTDLLDRVGGGTVGREVGRFLQGLFGAPPQRSAPPADE